MPTFRSSRYVLVFVLAATVSLQSAPSIFAGVELTVAPVRVYIAPTQKSAVLRVSNPNATPLTVQARLYKWSQDAEGKDVLDPTTDLIAFPQMLTLKPGAERNIRVGTLDAARTEERTFRIILEPILTTPPVEGAGDGPEARSAMATIITRSSIPIFLQAPKSSAAPIRSAASVEHGRLHVAVTNTGAVHVPPPTFAMKGYNSTGELVLEGATHGWYVLPGTTRIDSVPLPKETCPKVTHLEIEIRNGQQVETVTVPVDPDRCLP